MNIKLICVGKTDDTRIQEMIEEFQGRLKHYVNFELEIVSLKNKQASKELNSKAEAELLLNHLNANSFVVLLDERGSSYTSKEFSSFIQKRMNSGIKELTFIIGGAFGFHKSLYEKANAKLALSKMTFTHQMVRLVFVEQLYRALTILRGEKYHH